MTRPVSDFETGRVCFCFQLKALSFAFALGFQLEAFSSLGLRFRELLDEEQDDQHHDDGDREDHEPVLNQTGQHEADERHDRDRDRVRQLRLDVVDVFAAGTCGGHDGRIGNRRAVVAADSASQAGGHTDEQQRAGRIEDVDDNRNQNTECAPRRTGRERQHASQIMLL